MCCCVLAFNRAISGATSLGRVISEEADEGFQLALLVRVFHERDRLPLLVGGVHTHRFGHVPVNTARVSLCVSPLDVSTWAALDTPPGLALRLEPSPVGRTATATICIVLA